MLPRNILAAGLLAHSHIPQSVARPLDKVQLEKTRSEKFTSPVEAICHEDSDQVHRILPIGVTANPLTYSDSIVMKCENGYPTLSFTPQHSYQPTLDFTCMPGSSTQPLMLVRSNGKIDALNHKGGPYRVADPSGEEIRAGNYENHRIFKCENTDEPVLKPHDLQTLARGLPDAQLTGADGRTAIRISKLRTPYEIQAIHAREGWKATARSVTYAAGFISSHIILRRLFPD
jgi:hypothetical protein